MGRSTLVRCVRPCLAAALVAAGIGLLGMGCGTSSPSGPDEEATGPTVSFTDVSDAAGLGAFHHQTGAFGQKWYPETMGGGGGVLDYNGDGALDLLLVGGGVWPKSEAPLDRALWLYRNDGDGTFTLVSEQAGLTGLDVYGFGVTVADYDNDGDSDFLLTTLGRNRLFRNDGDGTFTEVGREAGLTAEQWSSAAVFFDADRDGHLDLYVGNYIKWSPAS
ncbi:MAG: FG-GAP repeat domain-containing protein, partial [Salinibacter sp.]